MKPVIPEELLEFIKNEAARAEYFLLDISARAGKTMSLQITVDKKGGITLAECSDLNRTVSLWMEKSGVCGELYTVDVSSPGLDRVLKTDTELEWARGRLVTVSLFEPVNEKKRFSGTLSEHTVDNITVKKDPDGLVVLDRKNIAKVQLDPGI